jgi:hypothetical protein
MASAIHRRRRAGRADGTEVLCELEMLDMVDSVDMRIIAADNKTAGVRPSSF